MARQTMRWGWVGVGLVVVAVVGLSALPAPGDGESAEAGAHGAYEEDPYDLKQDRPLEGRYQLHNAVISTERRKADSTSIVYENVLRIDTETGRVWILRPNRNLAGFSWVLIRNYEG